MRAGQQVYMQVGTASTSASVRVSDTEIGVTIAVNFHVSGLGSVYDDSVYCYALKTSARAKDVCKALSHGQGYSPNFSDTEVRYTIGKW